MPVEDRVSSLEEGTAGYFSSRLAVLAFCCWRSRWRLKVRHISFDSGM
jgi:hypothetical protein